MVTSLGRAGVLRKALLEVTSEVSLERLHLSFWAHMGGRVFRAEGMAVPGDNGRGPYGTVEGDKQSGPKSETAGK